MKVNICGIPHTVIEKDDNFTSDNTHLGEITYSKAEIFINKDITDELKHATLCHEILHGILEHLGEFELNNNEAFVTRVGNALSQSFEVRLIDDDNTSVKNTRKKKG